MFEHLYAFTPQLILRVPARPFSVAIDAADVWAALADAAFCEALYLASPALYEECARWQRGELTDARKLARLHSTLVRYYTRSSTRSTPFGLFAGCAVVQWGPASAIRLAPGPARRHTRLDMHYLCALGQQLAEHPALQLHLRCYPNTSLHWRGAELRYVEQQYGPAGALHQLSALDASAPLQQVVAAAAAGIMKEISRLELDASASCSSSASSSLENRPLAEAK